MKGPSSPRAEDLRNDVRHASALKPPAPLKQPAFTPLKIRRAILFVNPGKKQARLLADEICAELNARDIKADIFHVGEKSHFSGEAAYDAAISLGGDGTVLSVARAVSPLNIPIFPVNLGTFGFIAGVQPLEWREVFDRWTRGEAVLSRRLMLDITVKRRDEEIFKSCCLNDAVISALAVARIIRLKVFCGEPEAPGGLSGGTDFFELGQYRSDGLIISTPTGSTAYSAAAGGPVVDPELEAVILNPICPFTLTHRPMVLPAAQMIMIEVDEGQREKILLTIDGQVTEKLKSGDKIYFSKAPNYCLLVASGRKSFFHALKTKLAWVGDSVEGRHD